MNVEKPGRLAFFVCLFVFSGFSGLVYQVVWARKLQLAFGVTAFAISAVLAAFFLGLAIGSALGGKLSDRLARPLVAYGAIEIAIGVMAVLMTPYLDSLDVLLRPLSGLLEGHFWLLNGSRFILTMLVLLVPTVLLGATVPLMTRGLVSRLRDVGTRVAVLYAANTLGAVLGVIMAGFFLVEAVGLDTTVKIAAFVSVAVGVLAIFGQKTVFNTERAESGAERGEESTALAEVPGSLVLFVMALSGAMGLGLEVLWTRILIQRVSATGYVFATVLAMFLIGIALGSYAVKRRINRWKNPVAALAVCEVLIGVLTLLGLPILDRLMPSLTVYLFNFFGVSTGGLWFVAWMLWGAGLLLPMTILLGATFPLAARLISTDPRVIGDRVGRLYAVNTMGGVFGVFLVGFILIPQLGVHATIVAIAWTQASLGILLSLGALQQRKAALITIGTPVALMIVLGITFSGDQVRARMTEVIKGDTRMRTEKLPVYKDDYYGSVVVSKDVGAQNIRRLWVNGVTYSSTAPYAMRYMRLQGHIPMMMFPGRPKEALVICFGVGLTAGSLATYPEANVTVVELSKEILDLAGMYSDVNENVGRRQSVRKVVDDGRNFLLRNPDKQFDVITLEPPPPSQAGMANLYSKEFYALVRDHLTPDGMAAQWIPLHTQTDADTRMLLATFQEVFPNATLWWTATGETMVLGAKSHKEIPPGHLDRYFEVPSVKRSLAEIGIHNQADFNRTLLLDSWGLREYADGAPVMTDDRPVIEYRFPPNPAHDVDFTLRSMFALASNPRAADELFRSYQKLLAFQ